jgi:serine/threonine-protein kinase ULK/ATG1
MEFCTGGDLSQFIKKRTERPAIQGPAGGLREDLVKHLLMQLASALEYLRSKNLVHRDIKPQVGMTCYDTYG